MAGTGAQLDHIMAMLISAHGGDVEKTTSALKRVADKGVPVPVEPPAKQAKVGEQPGVSGVAGITQPSHPAPQLLVPAVPSPLGLHAATPPVALTKGTLSAHADKPANRESDRLTKADLAKMVQDLVKSGLQPALKEKGIDEPPKPVHHPVPDVRPKSVTLEKVLSHWGKHPVGANLAPVSPTKTVASHAVSKKTESTSSSKASKASTSAHPLEDNQSTMGSHSVTVNSVVEFTRDIETGKTQTVLAVMNAYLESRPDAVFVSEGNNLVVQGEIIMPRTSDSALQANYQTVFPRIVNDPQPLVLQTRLY